jgi:hypothetical protein
MENFLFHLNPELLKPAISIKVMISTPGFLNP